MREYYYLTALESSPYDLTITDALHLGANSNLSIYAFITEPVVMECRETGIRYTDDSIFLLIPALTVAAIEKRALSAQPTSDEPFSSNYQTHHQQILKQAMLDDKYSGSIPTGTPFQKQPNPSHWVYTYKAGSVYKGGLLKIDSEHQSVGPADLLCWTEDLERLAKHGHIQRRVAASTGNADPERHEYPPYLEALIIAWRKNWKNADRTDRSACPRKEDVKAWLMAQGFSAKNADAGATIIKPQWAIDKGW